MNTQSLTPMYDAATTVAQVSNLPYRGFPIRKRCEVQNGLPTGSRRYSRLETCATSACAMRTRPEPAARRPQRLSAPNLDRRALSPAARPPRPPTPAPGPPQFDTSRTGGFHGSCLLRGRHPGYPAAQASPHTPRLGCGCGWRHYSQRRGVRRLAMAPPRQTPGPDSLCSRPAAA